MYLNSRRSFHGAAFDTVLVGALEIGRQEKNMTTFPDREHGFEAKFAHDEEVKFRATARRDGLVAHWASQKLGLVGAAANDYVKQVLAADLENPGTDSVFKKIRADFDASGIVQSDDQIRLAMDQFLSQAFIDIKAGR
jgi:hypothetical protein